MKKVTVFMSTYNGEKYLSEQIESILHQKNVDVQLIVRDDGSSDNTVAILQEYAEKYSNIELHIGQKNLGACGSFFDLICSRSDGEYFALSDQDDIWDDDKLYCAVQMLSQYRQDVLALYFSNLRVVDADMHICRMFYNQKPAIKNRYSGFVDTYATGCTMVYNQPLAKLAKQVKPTAFSMHDAWLFDTACLFGKTVYDEKPHISYRQHENNVIGARLKISKMESIRNQFRRLFRSNLHPYSDNARILYQEFKSHLSDKDRELLKSLGYYKESFGTRVKVILNRDLATKSRSRNIRFKLLVLLGLA